MAHVVFTKNLAHHLPCPPADVAGRTVRQVLDAVFADNPRVRSYILDEQGAVRTHVTLFVDGLPIRDRKQLTDPVDPKSEIYVMQALSGG